MITPTPALAYEGYNGWRNWETWVTHLWLTNDEGTYRYWREQGEVFTTTHGLAYEMRAEVPTSGAVGDSVSWHRVDWDQVAEAFLEARVGA
jgi:hypothetical protein